MSRMLLFLLPLGLLALFAVLTIGRAWTNRQATPQLILDLPQDPAQASAEFEHRLQAAFPAGSSEARMITELAQQGFATLPDHLRAIYQIDGFPCATVWDVRWQKTNGQITALTGTRARVCL